MSDIDPELRDKIIQTHTLVKRIDEDQKEHKRIMNARLRDAKDEFGDHKKEVAHMFEKHDARIEKGENFRTKVMAYAAVVAAVGAIVIELAITSGKKLLGIA